MSQVLCCAGEAQPLVQVDGEHGLGAVVGQALEQLGEVRDPERGLEPGPDLLPALREIARPSREPSAGAEGCDWGRHDTSPRQVRRLQGLQQLDPVSEGVGDVDPVAAGKEASGTTSTPGRAQALDPAGKSTHAQRGVGLPRRAEILLHARGGPARRRYPNQHRRGAPGAPGACRPRGARGARRRRRGPRPGPPASRAGRGDAGAPGSGRVLEQGKAQREQELARPGLPRRG